MNVVTTAISSAGAPGAGVLPGAQAVAAPGAGPSFADVFRGLSGEDGGAFTTGDAAVVGEGGAGGWVSGRPNRTEAGGAADAAEGAAPSPDDYLMGMAATIVPVAVNLTPAPAPPLEVPAECGDVANESGWGHVGVRMAGPTATIAAAPPVTGSLSDPTSTGAGSAEELAVAGAGDVSQDGAGSSAGPGLVTSLSGGAANVGAPAGRVPGERVDAGGLALGRAVGPAGGGRGVGRRAEVPLSAAPVATASPGAAIAAAAMIPAPETAPGPEALVPAPGTTAPVPALALGLAVPATTAVPAETMASGPQAAPVSARLMNVSAGDVSRALGLPRTLARMLEGAAGAAEVPTAEAAAAASLAAGAPALAGATSELTDAAPTVAAAVRARHPVLAAALRAFQQAGATAAGAEPSHATLHQDQGEAPGAATPVAAARLTALASAATDGVSAAVAAERRPLAMPLTVGPMFSGELRVSNDLAASARVEPAGLVRLDTADGEAVHAQIVQSLRVQWAGGAGEARVRLRPEYLGEVVATVKVEQGIVTATLQADRPDVRRWMEANLQTLRDGLVEHGLKLDRLVVVSEPARGETADDKHGRPRGRQPNQPPQPRPRRPRQDGDPATFEVNT